MENPFVIVPLGGNSFIVNKPQSKRDEITPEGFENWSNEKYEYHVYFKVARDATLRLKLLCQETRSASTILTGIGVPKIPVEIEGGTTEVDLGSYSVKKGYVDVAFKGLSRKGSVFAEPYALKAEGISDEEMASYARESDKDSFYWIRRGPSVHMNYDISGIGENVKWFYNEATVMPGEDPHGTYCMAIGFRGGYYGMQVCGNGIRKLLFSIWSPHVTDDPSTIPEDKMVRVLKKHPKVKAGEFGGEGSGGQSYMDYDWKSGETYRFLCSIEPQEHNKTKFTSYFYFKETGKWELFCSFLRPETQTWFASPHSFLESFIDVNGNRFRRAHFKNQWAVTESGKWIPVGKAKLTGDNTARKAQRQDYGGGAVDNHFYLNNCGFFSENSVLDSVFEIDTASLERPSISLEEIEKL